jgi:hypothetical protein
MRIRIWSNANMERMLLEYEYRSDIYQYGTDTDNKVIVLYLTMSQVYNDIIHNIRSPIIEKKTFVHFSSVFS